MPLSKIHLLEIKLLLSKNRDNANKDIVHLTVRATKENPTGATPMFINKE